MGLTCNEIQVAVIRKGRKVGKVNTFTGLVMMSPAQLSILIGGVKLASPRVGLMRCLAEKDRITMPGFGRSDLMQSRTVKQFFLVLMNSMLPPSKASLMLIRAAVFKGKDEL